jgi:hypothetical protein
MCVNKFSLGHTCEHLLAFLCQRVASSLKRLCYTKNKQKKQDKDGAAKEGRDSWDVDWENDYTPREFVGKRNAWALKKCKSFAGFEGDYNKKYRALSLSPNQGVRDTTSPESVTRAEKIGRQRAAQKAEIAERQRQEEKRAAIKEDMITQKRDEERAELNKNIQDNNSWYYYTHNMPEYANRPEEIEEINMGGKRRHRRK